MAKPKCEYFMCISFPVLWYHHVPVLSPPAAPLTRILCLLIVLSKAKACMADAAGLRFVVTTPAQTRDKHDRKVIRGHATRAGVAGRHVFRLRSWISPDRELEALTMAKEAPTSKSALSAPSPTRVGGDFSGLQLPSGVEPYMIQDLCKCIYSLLLIFTRLRLNRKGNYTIT